MSKRRSNKSVKRMIDDARIDSSRAEQIKNFGYGFMRAMERKTKARVISLKASELKGE